MLLVSICACVVIICMVAVVGWQLSKYIKNQTESKVKINIKEEVHNEKIGAAGDQTMDEFPAVPSVPQSKPEIGSNLNKEDEETMKMAVKMFYDN